VKNKPPAALVAVTALLLAGYLGILAWAWSSTTTDPQAGMAVGFLMLITLVIASLIGLFWYGVARGRSRAVWVVFVICAFPSLSLVARAIYLATRWLNHTP
jgi:hypothetical protein